MFGLNTGSSLSVSSPGYDKLYKKTMWLFLRDRIRLLQGQELLRIHFTCFCSEEFWMWFPLLVVQNLHKGPNEIYLMCFVQVKLIFQSVIEVKFIYLSIYLSIYLPIYLYNGMRVIEEWVESFCNLWVLWVDLATSSEC